jgi:hypothetical protein
MRPAASHGDIHEALQLIRASHVRRAGEVPCRHGRDPLCQFLDAIGAPRTQHHRSAFFAEKVLASPSPLLAPVMTTIFPVIRLFTFVTSVDWFLLS